MDGQLILVGTFLSSTVLYAIFLTYLAPFLLGINITISLSNIFNNVGIGLGSIIAGVGGLKLLAQLAEERSVRRKTEMLKAQYPTKLLGSTYKLISFEDDPGKIWLWDLERGMLIRHIGNYETYLLMGFKGEHTIRFSGSERSRYVKGDPILITGFIGT